MSAAPHAKGRALLYCAGGGLGDSLVASVIAQALRQRYASVDALTLPGHVETLERVPDVDRVLKDEGDENDVASIVAAERYDACIVSWATARTARIAQHAKIPIRVGQARRLYSFRFTKRVTVRSELGDVTSPWSDILLDYARAIGCDAMDARPRFVPTTRDEEQARDLRERFQLDAGQYILLHPTNAVAIQRGMWPVEGWIALARALRAHFDLPVAITGAQADSAIAAAIAREARVLDLSGTSGIGAFGALARSARAFVGITTGSMHVAAAVGTPTIGIFPFQADVPDRWAPRGARTAVVRASYPCHAGDTKETCADYACIAHLDVPRVVTTVEETLRRR